MTHPTVDVSMAYGEQTHKIPVVSIICLNDLLSYLQGHHDLQQHLPAVKAYREQYGV